jgi:hypothetical protein
MAVGEIITMSGELPDEGRTPTPASTKRGVDQAIQVPHKHKYLTTLEFAKSDVEASTPTITPDASVPFLIGRKMIVSPQVLWYGNYSTIFERDEREERTEQKVYEESSAGPLISKVKVITNTIVTLTPIDYGYDMVLGLCLGPGVQLRNIFNNNKRIWQGTTSGGVTELTGVEQVFDKATFYSGEFDQPADPRIIGGIGETNTPAFVGICYIVIHNVASQEFANSSLTFDLQRIPTSLYNADMLGLVDTNEDINAAAVLHEIVRSDWGGAGIRAGLVHDNSFEDAYLKFLEKDYYISILIENDNYVANTLETINALVGCDIYVDPDNEKLTLITYAPEDYDEDEAIAFDESNVTSVQSMVRSSWSSMPTDYEIKFTRRSERYQTRSIRRRSKSIDSDKRREMELLSVNASIVNSVRVARKILTRVVMTNGVPKQMLTLEVNSDGGKLKPGSAIKLSWADYQFSDVPFYVTAIGCTDIVLDQYVIEGYYFLRPDSGDFDDFDDETSDWTDIDTTPVIPTYHTEVELAPNILRRLGVDFNYDGESTFPSYMTLLIAAANDGQVNADLLSSTGAFIQTIPYCASGYVTSTIPINAFYASGMIPEITLENCTFASIAPGAKLAYWGGEFFSFESADALGSLITLYNVRRALYGSLLREIDDSVPFMIFDDNPLRVLPPRNVGALHDVSLVPRSYEGLGDDTLDFQIAYVETVNRMNSAQSAFVDGVLVAPSYFSLYGVGEAPEIFFDETYEISWINRSRVVSEFETLRDDASGEEFIPTQQQRYRLTFRDSAFNTHELGATDIPGVYFENIMYSIDGGYLTLAYPIAGGLGTLFIYNEMVSSYEPYISETEATSAAYSINLFVSAAPALLAELELDYVIGFAPSITFDYEILNEPIVHEEITDENDEQITDENDEPITD